MNIQAEHNGLIIKSTTKMRQTFYREIMKLFAEWVEAGMVHHLAFDEENMEEEGIIEEPLLRSELEKILANPLEVWLDQYGGDLELDLPINEYIETMIMKQCALSEEALEQLWDDNEWVDFFIYLEEMILDEIGKIPAKTAYERYGTLNDPLSVGAEDPPELIVINNLVQEIIQKIEKIPGQKVITFTGVEDEIPFSGDIDCSKEGVWGDYPEDLRMFQDILLYLLEHSGNIVIRQFLNIKLERETSNGEKVWVPKKNIYALVLEEEAWFPVPKDDLLAAYSVDHETGQPIPPDRDLIFCHFPE